MKKFDVGCPLEYVLFDVEESLVRIQVPHPCAPDMGKTLVACERAFGKYTFNHVVVVDSLGERVVSYRSEDGEWRAWV